MTEHAATAEKQFAATLRRCVARIGGRLAPRFGPRCETIRRKRNDIERHEGMLQTAIFRAATREFTRFVGAKADGRDAAGNQVLLAMQIGNPEAVDDVVGLKGDDHRPPDRNVELVRRREDMVGLRIVVDDFPPVLMRSDAHVQRIVDRHQRKSTIGEYARHEQADKQDRRD